MMTYLKDKMDMFSVSFIKVFLVLLSTSLLYVTVYPSECQSKNVQAAMTQVEAGAKKIAEYEKRLSRLLSPVAYRYSPAGKPDPFRPFFRTATSARKSSSKMAKNKRSPKCATPLECMDVGQLTLVGIVHEADGTSIAMAQDASGIGYTLKPGMRIGYQKGRVVAIEREKVVVREKVEDLKGKLKYRDRILYLHPEESDEAD